MTPFQFFTNRTISNLTDFQFRLYVNLVIFAEEDGSSLADPDVLKGQLFPRLPQVSPEQIHQALEVLAEKELIYLHEYGEYCYYYLLNVSPDDPYLSLPPEFLERLKQWF